MDSDSAASINILPNPTLFDVKTQIKISGLSSYQDVTLVAVVEKQITMVNETVVCISHGYFVADSQGNVDTFKDPSIGGTYTGVEPMGYILGMLISDKTRPHSVYRVPDVTIIQLFRIFVLDGHTKVTDESHIKNVICKTVNQRFVMAHGVTRRIIQDGHLRGSYFVPPGSGPFPAILNLEGGAGGLHDYRAALLANKGFTVLCLAYQNFMGLKDPTQPLELTYFEEAVDWLTKQPEVANGGIGVLGYSKGCEMALHVSICKPQVRAVILYHTKDHRGGPMTHHDQLLPFFPKSTIPEFLSKDMLAYSFYEKFMQADIPEDTLFQIEKAKNVVFLFITGTDDRITPPEFTDKLIDRLKHNGKSNYRLLRYDDHGHDHHAPYLVPTITFPLRGHLLYVGGDRRMNGIAQEHAWSQSIDFLRNHLPKAGATYTSTMEAEAKL